MCIVVVDDEHDLLELVRHVLTDEGYSVLLFDHPLYRALCILARSPAA